MYSKVEDFLKDDDFIKYVLDDAPESAFHWDKLLKEHAELLKVFEEAKNVFIIRKSKFPQNPKRSVRFSGKGTKRSVQKRKARNTQKAETKVL